MGISLPMCSWQAVPLRRLISSRWHRCQCRVHRQHLRCYQRQMTRTASAPTDRSGRRMLPSMPCLALPCLALPCLALPCLALPCLALPCLAGATTRSPSQHCRLRQLCLTSTKRSRASCALAFGLRAARFGAVCVSRACLFVCCCVSRWFSALLRSLCSTI